MIVIFRKRPWLVFILAFALLLAGWSVFLTLAIKNKPQTVERVVLEPREGEG